MTREEMREKVALICECYLYEADAAIAIVLEEAAKAFDDMWSLSIRPSAAAGIVRDLARERP